MKKLLTMLALFVFALSVFYSATATSKNDADKTQRKATGVFDVQKTTAGNVELALTNSGVIGFDLQKSSGGGFWPRGSQNQYIYGSGIWFGAQKMNPDKTSLQNYVEIGYNPNSGISWFVPGMVKDGDKVREDLTDKYRLYFSTDFDMDEGTPFMQDDGPNWPLWISDTSKKYQYGTYKHDYVDDITRRNKTEYPMGPLFVSDEDIISIYKDTDLDRYEGGAAKRKAQGYPLGLEVQSNVYSWNSEDMKDVVLVSKIITNTSTDTLYNCWVAGFYDIDLAYAPNGSVGASNDRAKFFADDESLNLGVAWTETNQGESGKNFGYIGISMLETPAINDEGYIRNDKLIFEPEEQLGLKTFSSLNIAEDLNGDDERYNYMSAMKRDGDFGAGDKRMFQATGPFNMKPGDKARVVFAINFAAPAKGGEADGTLEDIEGLKDKANNGADIPQGTDYNNSLTGNLKLVRDKYYNKILPTIVENNNPGNLKITVFPNPVRDNIFINYDAIAIGNTNYEIYSIEGIKVAGGIIAPRIEVSSLIPGFYQLRIGNQSVKFMKY